VFHCVGAGSTSQNTPRPNDHWIRAVVEDYLAPLLLFDLHHGEPQSSKYLRIFVDAELLLRFAAFTALQSLRKVTMGAFFLSYFIYFIYNVRP